FELDFWTRFPDDGGTSTGYADRLTAATGFRYRQEGHLADMDEGFYSADYLRAWIRSAQLRSHLVSQFGEDWWRNPKTGELLRGLFAEGTKPLSEEIAARLGFDPLDTAPLVHELVLVFIGIVLASGRAAANPPAHTLVVAQTTDFASLDPALAQGDDAWELEYATCAKLVDYRPRAGYRGTQLEPEVATALPRVSADRLTYTVTVRKGWRFSNGAAVTAASFARAFQRAAAPALASPASAYLRGVRSWRVAGRSLVVRLNTPAPDFPQRLALPYFCAVPPSTPDRQTDDLPSAGPYAVASYQPGRSLLLRRNPY